jgi:hypothetical protein
MSLMAGPMGFKPFAFFEAEAGDREVPKVNFASGTPTTPGTV